MTESDIDKLCAEAGIDASSAIGKLATGCPSFVRHILAMAGASSLLGLAAQQLVLAEFQEQVGPGDPRVIALMRGWGLALLRYPDQQAVGQAMTEARDRVIAGNLDVPTPEVTDGAMALLYQIARCKDPLADDSGTPDIDDCIETISRIIQRAKALVGDLEETHGTA